MADDEGMLLTRIVIERRLSADGGDEIGVEFEDSNGDMPGLVEILGMLAMTQDTAIRMAMADDDG
jgi:hypothetical protein